MMFFFFHLACSRCERLTGVGAGSGLAALLALVFLPRVLSVVTASSSFAERVARFAELVAGVAGMGGDKTALGFLPLLVVVGAS